MHPGACFQEGRLDGDAIKRDALKGDVTGENHTPGQGRSQFPSLFPELLLWSLGHADGTEHRETLTVSLIKSRLVDTERRERVGRVERVAWKRAHQLV